MQTIKCHFDGVAVILDEPASLKVGQAVRVVVDSPQTSDSTPSPLGEWKGKVEILDDGDADVLDHFKDYLP